MLRTASTPSSRSRRSAEAHILYAICRTEMSGRFFAVRVCAQAVHASAQSSIDNQLVKNLVEFRRRRGERKPNHFLRRHVRLRKYFSACKRARRPPWADGACAAVRPQTPLSKKRRFFDSLTPWVCAYCTGSWGFSLFRALAAQEKDQQRQQRAGEIARRVEPDVRDLPAAAGDEELDRLVAQRGARAGQQRSRP